MQVMNAWAYLLLIYGGNITENIIDADQGESLVDLYRPR